MNARITIRPTVYHGDQGYCVSGTDARGRNPRIFVTTRWQADVLKLTLKQGGSEAAISAILQAQPFCTSTATTADSA